MADALWQWDDLVGGANGTAEGAPVGPITGFSLDTRTIAPGEVFVALKDQRDGHEFVQAAFKAGAAAALVARTYERKTGDGALIRVDDTLNGLERIGAAARARLSHAARVIAVTGSAGKTGTKEMLRACLSRLGPTHAPEKSFNNHWGVPLTLARMPAATRYAVIEIGMNHAGEITPLTRLTRPHVAIITNVLPVHVGNFPDGEVGVANAKAEILAGLEMPGGGAGGTAVLNRDSPHFDRLAARAHQLSLDLLTFGRHAEADVRAAALDLLPDGTRIVLRIAGRDVSYQLGAPGEHLALNSLAVVAALHALRVDLDKALPALAEIRAAQGRGARSLLKHPKGGHVLLIDESYNANPASMRAALLTMGTVPRAAHPRRLAVMGDMLELGSQASELHRGLASTVGDSGTDLVFACGPNMKLLFDDLPQSVLGRWAPASDGLVAAVLDAVQPGDVVMVKGSLGSRMAPIVAAIKARFGAGA